MLHLHGGRSPNVTRTLSILECSFLLASLVSLASLPAAAQDERLGPEPAAAELFRQGRELIKSGDWGEGCEKLELSMKRYPAPSTLMNIARCREHDGRIATAWALYRRALVLNLETHGVQRKRELDEVAQNAIDALDLRLPRILVTVVPKVKGVHATEGGRALPLDTTVPLDPGAYEVLVRAAGYEEIRRRVRLVEGVTTTVTVRMEAVSPGGAMAHDGNDARPPAPVSQPGPTGAPFAPPDDNAVNPSPTPLWAWFAGGSGIAFAALSVGFAVDAQLTARALEERCGADLVCDEDLSYDPVADNARKNRGIALGVGFGIGALGALSAATVGILWKSSGANVAAAPLVLPGGIGLVVRGTL